MAENIMEVIGWKFDHQEGMSVNNRNPEGEMRIVEFPGGIPSQADQDLWTQQYEAHLLANPPKEDLSVDDLFDILVSKGILTREDRPDRSRP